MEGGVGVVRLAEEGVEVEAVFPLASRWVFPLQSCCYSCSGMHAHCSVAHLFFIVINLELHYVSQAFFVMRNRKKLKGIKTQEIGNSRKKLKLKKKYTCSGILMAKRKNIVRKSA